MQYEKVLVPIPTHFSKDMFTIAVLENFDHQDRSSQTDHSNHDTVSTLFQVKPDHTASKPLPEADSEVVQGARTPPPSTIFYNHLFFQNHFEELCYSKLN